jgi:hypothetical protein
VDREAEVADGGRSGPEDQGTGAPPEAGLAGRWPVAPGGSAAGGLGGTANQHGDPSNGGQGWADSLLAHPAGESGRAPTDAPICQFLRSINPDGSLDDPQSVAVSNHRCAAFGDPLPLSLRQQELVCLQRVHVSCPRYLRGTVLASEAALNLPQEEERSRPGLIALAALALVVVAVAILVTGPVLGILPFGGAATSPSPIIVVVSPSSEATATAASRATTTPTATAAITPGAGKPTPAATPTAPPTWPPGATASRMNLLTPCTGGQSCYIYVVRGPGQNGSQVTDTLAGVATYFGVKVSLIVALNPGLTANSVLVAGQDLKIPPPTR